MLEVVGQQMHGHSRHGDVNLPAGGTLLGHFAVHTAVRLLVSAQVGRRGICFSTLIARVPLKGPGAADGFSPRPPIRDEEGVNRVALADRVVSVDVARGDLRLRAVGLVRIWRSIVAVDGFGRGHFDAVVALAIVRCRGHVVADVACEGEGDATVPVTSARLGEPRRNDFFYINPHVRAKKKNQ